MTGPCARERLPDPQASGDLQALSALPLPAHRHRHRRRRVVVLATFMAIGLLAASLSGCARAGARSPAPSTATGTPISTSSASTRIRFHPAQDGLFCATQVAWSPDSTRIAVVGNRGACSGAGPGRTPGLIVIYASASGHLIQRLEPDAAVLALPAIAHQVAANAAGGGALSTLTYQSLAWTPDDQALVMSFDLELQPAPTSGSTGIYGLQRLGVTDASRTAVWLDASASHFAPLERWNLVTGAADVPPAPAHATAYQWTAGGLLVPAGAPGEAVGSPDGGQTFTVWQPGQLLFGTTANKATQVTTVLAQDIGWVSTTSPIPPDGSYFYPNMITAGSLVPPSTQQALFGGPVLLPHDHALVALAQQMMRTPSPSQNVSTLIAWRPDGRYLAAWAQDAAAATTPTAAAFAVSIYDTASGTVVTQVMPDFTGLRASPAARGTTVTLVWSPDGSRLLLADNLYGAITLWRLGALPA